MPGDRRRTRAVLGLLPGLTVPVHLLGDVVVKTGTSSTRLEAAKLSAYRRLSRSLVVPQVLLADPVRDVLVLERLIGYDGLQQVFLRSASDPEGAAALFMSLGEVLAQLHDLSAPSAPWVHELVGGRGGHEDESVDGYVLLHGDFGFSNVLVHRLNGAIAILDPVPRHMPEVAPDGMGDPLHDLASMVSCLLGRVPARHLLRIPRLPRRRLITALVQGYVSGGRASHDVDRLVHEAAQHLQNYLVDARHVPRRTARHVVQYVVDTL